MSQSTQNRSRRLAAYSALAGGVIPVTAAMGAFVGENGLNLEANPFSAVAVDMGAGYGEIFTFFVNTGTGYGGSNRVGGFTSTTQMFVGFNPANTGGWTDASVVRYNGPPLWPKNMTTGEFIGASESWQVMNQFSSSEHLMAGRFFSSSYTDRAARGSSTTSPIGFSTTSGDWAPNESGYVGLRFTKNGGADYEYAWIHASVNLDFSGGRPFRGPGGDYPTLTIDAWGLETTPGAGLGAGLPTPGVGALAMLALGAAGIRRTRGPAA